MYREGLRFLSLQAISPLPPQRRHWPQYRTWGQLRRQRPPLVGSVAKAAAPPGRVAPAAVLHTAAQVDAAAAAPVAAARPQRGAVLTRAVTQWTPHEGWELPSHQAGLRHVKGQGGRFSQTCDERIKAVYYDRRQRDFMGETVDREEMYAISRAMSRMLRHSSTLRCNNLGLVWLRDLIDAMRIEERGLHAFIAQIALAVARDRNGRFQLVQQMNRSAQDPGSFVIRAVQGHSRPMLAQMDEAQAHTLVDYECDISHATYSHLLPRSLDLNHQAYCQGGIVEIGAYIVPARCRRIEGQTSSQQASAVMVSTSPSASTASLFGMQESRSTRRPRASCSSATKFRLSTSSGYSFCPLDLRCSSVFRIGAEQTPYDVRLDSMP